MFINLIGALTLKPYSFSARSWELSKYVSIDFFDSMASSTELEVRGSKILRVLPCRSSFVEDNWITDKARFGLDSLSAQRLSKYYFKNKWTDVTSTLSELGFSQSISLEIFFFFFLKKHGKTLVGNIYGLADALIDSATLIFFKDFLNLMGSTNLMPSLFNSSNFSYNLMRESFIFKNNLNKVLSSELFFFVGLNPRLESPIVNLKLRKVFLRFNTKFFSFTSLNNPNFAIQSLGNNINSFLNFCEGRHSVLSTIFNNKSFVILLGSAMFYRKDLFIILQLLLKINAFLPGCSFYSLYNKLTHILTLEYGFIPSKFSNQLVPVKESSSSIIFSLGSSKYLPQSLNLNSFSIYYDWAVQDVNIFLGSFGVELLKSYDYICPLAHLVETGGEFLSVLGWKEKVASLGWSYPRDFYWFYNGLYTYWFRFGSSTINADKRICIDINRLDQLGVGVTQYLSFSTFESLIELKNPHGSLTKNLINAYQVSPITDEYSANSFLMRKANKLYTNLYPSTYF